MVRLSVVVDLALFVALLVLVGIAAAVGSLTGLRRRGRDPLLIIVFGAWVPVAIGAGFVTILATSSATGTAYVRDRLSDLRIGCFSEIATVPGALIGATATVFLAHANLESALLVALGVVLLAIFRGAWLVGNIELPEPMPQDARARRLGLTGDYHDDALDRGVHSRRPGRPGARSHVRRGGGFGNVRYRCGGVQGPRARAFSQSPDEVSTPTSNFMIGVTAAAGAGVMMSAGYVNPVIAAPVAIGTAFGAYLGSRRSRGCGTGPFDCSSFPWSPCWGSKLILRGLGWL